ncbi:MAG: hypothetical protein M0R28_17150 [Pigmentiphaga sp.]|nr:hypothetical protein [Pigmentiphaga sp.]
MDIFIRSVVVTQQPASVLGDARNDTTARRRLWWEELDFFAEPGGREAFGQ